MIKLKPGDKLEVLKLFTTPARQIFEKGMILELMEPTNLNPYGYDPTGPHNWIVKHQYGKGVWTSIYHCIEIGFLKKVK